MKNSSIKTMHGFTLIELMIVVAIVAILAAIAIPAYQDYLIRSQVTEGASLSSGAKTAVEEEFANTGVPPTTNGAVGLPAANTIIGNYVSGVAIGNGGVITATYSSAAPQRANAIINGTTLVLTPTFNGGSTSWSCVNSTVPPQYLPSICRAPAGGG